jgi:hypothetical protein
VSVRQIELRTQDLIHHPSTGTLYASVPSSAGPGGNSLVQIDPLTAAVGTPAPVGSEPGQLALADDGRTLYVGLDGAGAVRRFDTETQAPGPQFSLGTTGNGQPFVAADIEVMPGSPQTVAVAKQRLDTHQVAVYDDGVQRPDTAGRIYDRHIEFGASPSRLYVNNIFGEVIKYDVTPAGLAEDGPAWVKGSEIVFDGGLLYSSGGTVTEPETATVRGEFAGVSSTPLVAVDAGLGRAYFVGAGELRVYDINTFLLIGKATLEGIGFTPATPNESLRISSLVRWGDNGLAFRTNSHVVILRSTLINPSGAVPPSVQFARQQSLAFEDNGVAVVEVIRTGDVSTPASVDYATADGTATERGDYTTAVGTLHFAPGERRKSFRVLVTNDALVETDETFEVRLSGAEVTKPDKLTVTIVSNDTAANAPNPIDGTSFFVRQHYADFLNREPDAGGLAHWSNEIEQCGADAGCREVKRINVSAAFFLSIEFQETGYLVYRTYKTAYGDATSPGIPGTVPVVRLREYLADTQRIGRGVQVGVGDWRAQLEANKNAYLLEFVQRQRFLDAYPLTLTPAEFVDKLNQNAGGVLSQGERDQLVAQLSANNTPAGRAAAVRAVAEHETLKRAEFNRAFVLMQYFGYLRRDPDSGQDATYLGWRFWLDKLEQFNGDFVRAEMVKAFLTSAEYQQRFGQ